MHRFATRLIAVLVSLGATGPLVHAQSAQPSLADLATRRAERPSKHLIWKVSREGETIAYLVGSIHVLTKASYPLPPLFDTAYAETRVLVEEVDMAATADPAMAAGVAAKALLQDGQTLKSLLDPVLYSRVSDKAAAAGMPMMLLDRMKPWLVAVTLMLPELQAAGFDPAQGLDRHFYERARADGRPVRGLETAAFQIDRMNGLSMPAQVQMLAAYLDDVEVQVKSVRELVAGWRSGDVPALEKLLLAELQQSAEVYQRLLVERNQAWAPRIAECQPSAPCLVVVGGAHLLGPDSVVALLTKAGFSVEQQ
jgi:uncharacterized protein YbaP (TraB family)